MRIFLLSALMTSSLSIRAEESNIQEENKSNEVLFCEKMRELYVESAVEHRRIMDGLSLIFSIEQSEETENFEWFNTQYRLMQGNKDSAIRQLEEIVEKTDIEDELLYQFALYDLVILYADKHDYEKALHWSHKFSSLSLMTIEQYRWGLTYSKICEEELKSALEEFHLRIQEDITADKQMNRLKNINLDTYIDFFNNLDNFPKDYVQAYYWADLAVKNQFPLAVELRELIVEKMSSEEIEQALSLSY